MDFDKELRTLVKDLWDTMESEQGAGLAAPQLGVGLRVFTYHCDGAAGHLVNPTWTALDEEYQDGEEGCLSIPGLYWDCRRHLTSWRAAGTCTASPWRSRAARCWRAASSTRPTTSTACCSSTGSTPETRKAAMKEIRQADWFDGGLPPIKQSPHSMFGGAV